MEICLYENGSVDIAGRKLGVCTHHEFFSEDETFPNKKYLLKDNLYTYVHFRIKSPNLLDLQKIGIPTDINEILHSQGVGGAAFLSGNGAILAMGHFPEGYIILNKDSVCTDYFIKTNHIQFTDIIFIHSKMPPSDKCRLLELSDEPGFDVVLQKLLII